MPENTSRGKWSMAGVPHRGWRYTDVDDVGDDLEICQMCESVEIRFVHVLEHDDYSAALRVGCVCAGHMTGDKVDSRRREAVVRSRSAKRDKWPTRRGWKLSKQGNEWIEADGYRVTIRQQGATWLVSLSPIDGTPAHGKRSFPSSEAAKLAAFDYISTQLRPK